MDKEFPKFDMRRPPLRQSPLLQPLVWALSLPDVRRHKSVIEKIGCEDLKPPYLLLGNHNAFFDFKVATKAIFPHRANYVIAIDGFIGREGLLRAVGGICKRKFTSDIQLIRNIKKVFEHGDILVLYPEARYSLCGTTAVLPESLGKLCKMMGVPVVTLICSGHHIDTPFWNLRPRGVKGTEARMRCLFTPEQLRAAAPAEITAAIRREFRYDDYAWQKEKGVRVTVPWRAEGLHKVLYQCPACGAEYRMDSAGDELFCNACGKRWRLSELGELAGEDGRTEFSHIPDWYEWERANVRREVEAGSYRLEVPCHVDSLPNARGYVRLGDGVLLQDMEGIRVSGSGRYGEFSMDRSAPSLYSCHIEYDYLGKYGDCVDLNTLEDTFYIYPHGRDFSVTKVALATEELYAHCAHRRTEAGAEH